MAFIYMASAALTREKTLKSTLKVLFFRLFSRLPFFWARWIGGQLGKLAYVLKTREYSTTLKNLEVCYPEMAQSERVDFAKRSLQETGKTALEIPVIWRLRERAGYLVKQVENETMFTSAINNPDGLIVVAPHHCNWELVGVYLSSITEVVYLYQPHEDPDVDNFVKRGRSYPQSSLAPTSKRGVLQIIKTLKAGGTTGILPDQIPEESSGGEFSTFFGQPAFTMTLVHSLIQRSGCQVIVCSTKRVEEGFEVIFQKPDDDIYSEDVNKSLAAINKTVEACIENSPAEYSWEYKRFRVRRGNQKAKAQGIEGVKY